MKASKPTSNLFMTLRIMCTTYRCTRRGGGGGGGGGGGWGGALPINGLMGMCRWMGSHFHDWTDYNGVAFSSIFYRVTRMGSHFCWILRVRKFWQVVIYKRKDSPKKKLPYSLLLFNISQTAPIK